MTQKKNKVAWITGGGTGIGKELALILAKQKTVFKCGPNKHMACCKKPLGYTATYTVRISASCLRCITVYRRLSCSKGFSQRAICFGAIATECNWKRAHCYRVPCTCQQSMCARLKIRAPFAKPGRYLPIRCVNKRILSRSKCVN